MKNYTVRYALPIALGLPEDVVFNFMYNGVSVLIKCKDIEGISLTSYITKDLNWLNTANHFALVTSQNQHGDKIQAVKLYLDETKDLKSNGYEEIAQHTIIDISLNAIVEEIAIPLAKQVVEYFIDTYRYILNEENLPFVSTKDSKVIMLFDSTDIENIKLDENFVSYSSQWHDPFRKGLRTRSVDTNKLPMFNHYLNSPTQIPMWLKILINAKDQSIVSGNHDMSIILIETAFECFVQSLLLEGCTKRNIIELVYRKGKGKEEKKDAVKAIQESNIKKLLTDYVFQVFNVKINDTKYYIQWDIEVNDLRNGIIHRGKAGYDEATAKNSCEVAYAFINFLEEVLK